MLVVGCSQQPEKVKPVEPTGKSPVEGPAAGLDLHARAVVVDLHNDVTTRMIDENGFDLALSNEDGHTDLPRMIAGGIDAQFLAVWVDPWVFPGDQGWSRALAKIDVIHDFVGKNLDHVELATGADQLRQIAAEGRIAILIGVEGGHALGDVITEELAIERLRQLHQKGVRYLTITWSNSNVFAGSSGDDAGKNSGLTDLGRALIVEMNDLGMLVDVSHVSDRAFIDIVKASRLPVIASHSSMRSLANHPRNMTDEMLRALADNDGLVAINFSSGFLDEEWKSRMNELLDREKDAMDQLGESIDDELEASWAVWRREIELAATIRPRVPLSRLIDHMEHALRVAGPEHVGLGSDFDGVQAVPEGMDDVAHLPAITRALLDRGFSEGDVLKLLGDNFLRVLEENEKGRAGVGNTDL
jgi:membrane dipeptidase